MLNLVPDPESPRLQYSAPYSTTGIGLRADSEPVGGDAIARIPHTSVDERSNSCTDSLWLKETALIGD